LIFIDIPSSLKGDHGGVIGQSAGVFVDLEVDVPFLPPSHSPRIPEKKRNQSHMRSINPHLTIQYPEELPYPS